MVAYPYTNNLQLTQSHTETRFLQKNLEKKNDTIKVNTYVCMMLMKIKKEKRGKRK